MNAGYVYRRPLLSSFMLLLFFLFPLRYFQPSTVETLLHPNDGADNLHKSSIIVTCWLWSPQLNILHRTRSCSARRSLSAMTSHRGRWRWTWPPPARRCLPDACWVVIAFTPPPRPSDWSQCWLSYTIWSIKICTIVLLLVQECLPDVFISTFLRDDSSRQQNAAAETHPGELLASQTCAGRPSLIK